MAYFDSVRTICCIGLCRCNDQEPRQSTNGYFFKLGSKPISWNNKQQSKVALSSTKEYEP
jgi:hypothetical protein